MKLKKLLIDLFDNEHFESERQFKVDNTLYGENELKRYERQILACDEFKECSELKLVSVPVFSDNGKSKQVQTYKLTEDTKFKGKVYLLSVGLTPKMYDPSRFGKPVKDGANISPTLYNPTNFEPYKKILLTFSPERKNDGITNHEAVIRQELHDILDKVLDNPKSYEMESERGVLVRGIFETVEHNGKVEMEYLVGELTESKDKMVFYLEKEEDKNGTGNISMRMKSKVITIELAQKFEYELGEKCRKLKLTEEDINKFLEENK